MPGINDPFLLLRTVRRWRANKRVLDEFVIRFPGPGNKASEQQNVIEKACEHPVDRTFGNWMRIISFDYMYHLRDFLEERVDVGNDISFNESLAMADFRIFQPMYHVCGNHTLFFYKCT